jgi:non-canonical (house-cleaning) NTP pyrophosphatase
MIVLQNIKKIWIWTRKPNKIQWLEHACSRVGISEFEVIWFSVDTWVSDQPLTREETLLWSFNRAKACFQQDTSLDLACGAEWWVFMNDAKTKVYMIGWVTLIDRDWYISQSYGWTIELPPQFTKPLLAWKELGTIMDNLRNTTWANHREWAVWFFTNNSITRAQSFETMIINAFVPWLHPDLYT